jgi:hypothetical protein
MEQQPSPRKRPHWNIRLLLLPRNTRHCWLSNGRRTTSRLQREQEEEQEQEQEEKVEQEQERVEKVE